jgi:multicomponent Na+:H+ antiporter subunit E
MSTPASEMVRQVTALSCWAFLVWVLLTWTATLSQMLFGAGAAVCVAIACAPLGPVLRPWACLNPRRVIPALTLLITALVRVVRANLSLARRIWAPSRPVPSGMVIVPTRARSAGELTAVGLITSVIVDNQIVDVDRGSDELQYHAVEARVPAGPPNYSRINEPVERYICEVDR